MRSLILSLFMAAGLISTTGVGSFACDAMKQQTELGTEQHIAQGTSGTGTTDTSTDTGTMDGSGTSGTGTTGTGTTGGSGSMGQ